MVGRQQDVSIGAWLSLQLAQLPPPLPTHSLPPMLTLCRRFPNLARMARQYLGCPASSATVERLFSVVGIAFSDKRKSAKASTLEAIAFTKLNLP